MDFTQEEINDNIREEKFPCPPEMKETVLGQLEDSPVSISSAFAGERAKQRLNGDVLGLGSRDKDFTRNENDCEFKTHDKQN